jgi:hypothetical protein
MFSLNVALITLACVTAGLVAGALVARILPGHHLRDESRDILKTASGLIATLVALVLGLLVGSTKSSFDSANAGIMQAGAKYIALDHHLARYGLEANDLRRDLREALRESIERIWPSDGQDGGNAEDDGMAEGLERLHTSIVNLQPSNDAQKAIQANALGVSNDLLQARWLLVEQTQYALPGAFLVVLIFWLSVLYIGFGMLTPRNATAFAALLICAVSISAALFLILELNHPFDGAIKVSSLPLEKALALLKI